VETGLKPRIYRDKTTDPPISGRRHIAGFKTIRVQHVQRAVCRRPHMCPTPHRVVFAAQNVLSTTSTLSRKIPRLETFWLAICAQNHTGVAFAAQNVLSTVITLSRKIPCLETT
jgi:hypothetical protein